MSSACSRGCKCEETLDLPRVSCRDSAWLLVQNAPPGAVAARFVSGYLVQLAPDQESLDGPSGPTRFHRSAHGRRSLCRCRLDRPGSDLRPVCRRGAYSACLHPGFRGAAAVTGAVSKCEVEFRFLNEVTRIHEDPRSPLPYSDEQWVRHLALGERVDAELTAMTCA